MRLFVFFLLDFLGPVGLGTKTILRRVVAHVLEVALVEVTSLLRKEEVDEPIVALELPSTDKQQLLRLLALLHKLRVHRVLVEAVDQLDKVLLKQLEFVNYGDFQGLEGLLHKHLLAVLCGQSEDVDDD